MALKFEKPDEQLLDELEQVAQAGERFLKELSRENRLPKDFPQAALEAMATGLNGLKDGTAEACRVPLESANKELRSIRTKHFISQKAAEILEAEQENNSPDTTMQSFEAAIDSAMEIYSKLALEEIDAALPTEPKQDNPKTAQTDQFIAESELGENAILGDIETAEEIVNQETKEGQYFVLLLHDALNLTRYTKGLIQLPKLTADWKSALEKRAKEIPGQITSAGKKLATDTGKLFLLTGKTFSGEAEKIDKFKNAPGKFTINTINSIEYGLVRWRETPTIPYVDEQVELAAEEEATRLLEDNKPVPDKIAGNVRHLNFSFPSFSNPELLANFPYLQRLYLYEANIIDITVLKGMTQLQNLGLGSTKITDIAVLEGMTQLQNLLLTDTMITDFTVLEGMTQLQNLLLSNTMITDIEVLKGMTQLQRLDLTDTKITDITVLKSMTQMQHLDLENTKIADITVLEGMAQLQYLDLKNTKIADITVLEGMAQLQHLDLENTKIADITALEGKTQLQKLYLENTNISDITVLEDMTQLQHLYLGNTTITDITVLEGMTQLENLYLNNTMITNIEALKDMPQMLLLYLENTNVTDWSPVDHVDNVYGRPDDWVRKEQQNQ